MLVWEILGGEILVWIACDVLELLMCSRNILCQPTDFTRYYETASLLLSLALEYGQPLWGTCLGFQMISDLIAGADVLSDFDSENLSLSLELTPAAQTSRLLGNAPPDVLFTLTSVNTTTNWHMYGVTPEDFAAKVAAKGMVSLSINEDRAGIAFVSTMEHTTAPIYATQWHPEVLKAPALLLFSSICLLFSSMISAICAIIPLILPFLLLIDPP